jgi:hypothetical protein
LAWEDTSAPRSVVWTRGRGVFDIPQTDPEGNRYRLEFMARDGSAVVGQREAIGPLGEDVQDPLLWTESEGLRVLGPLPPGAVRGFAGAVTSGGAVVGGSLVDAGGTGTGLFRWTELDGFSLVIPTQAVFSPPLMSDDGDTMVGTRRYEFAGIGHTGSVIWTRTSGIVELNLGDGSSTIASAMTPDGVTVVGERSPNRNAPGSMPGATLFMWRADLGYVDILAALAESGVELEGWQLGAPPSISADGRVIVGPANCGGLSSVYRLVLPR